MNQSNDADTSANASNDNTTEQGIAQGQWASSDSSGGHCGGCGDGGDISQRQSGSNSNSTTSANAEATTEQKNVNAPISILSFGSGGHDCGGCKASDGSDVHQSNEATTKGKADNDNATKHGVWQRQEASSKGSGCCPESDGHGSYGKDKHKADPCRCDGHDGDGIAQSQRGSNANSTDQEADATASTEQENLNKPFTFFGLGSAGGDMEQANEAKTTAKAGNANQTGQWIEQVQVASSGGGMA